MGRHASALAALVLFVELGVLFPACSGNSNGTNNSTSNNTTSTQPSPTSTRVVGLSGNLAFGNVQIGATRTATLTITNSGNSTLTVTALSFNPAGVPAGTALTGTLTWSWGSGTIAAGASQQVVVSFTAATTQSVAGTLIVFSDQTSGTNTIPMSWAGAPQPSSCSFTASIGSTVQGYPDGGSFPVTLTTGAGCAWTATAGASWLHVAGSSGGTGSGTVTINMDPNATGATRTGAVTIAGNAVTFNQTAQSGSSGGGTGLPQVSVSPTTINGGTVGECQGDSHSFVLTLTAPPDLHWRAIGAGYGFPPDSGSSATLSKTSGTGSASVTVNIVSFPYSALPPLSCTKLNSLPNVAGINFDFCNSSGTGCGIVPVNDGFTFAVGTTINLKMAFPSSPETVTPLRASNWLPSFPRFLLPSAATNR